MRTHFKLIFKEDPIRVTDITGKLPEDLLYPLRSAQKVIEYTFEHSRLIGQQLYYDELYYVESFQLDSDVPFSIGYELYTERIFFTFVMHNDIAFYDSERLINEAKDFSFHLAYEKAGTYEVQCNAGRTVMVVVSIMPQWLLDVTRDFKILNGIVRQLLDSDMPQEVLPACPIDSQVFQWLLVAREFDYRYGLARVNFISSHIILGLGYYEEQLQISGDDRIFALKKRIDLSYTDPYLDIQALIEESSLPDHTVRRKFKKTYNTTPHGYCLLIRMLTAKRLISQENIPIKEVWKMIGSKDESNFRKAYKKFFPNNLI